MMVDRADTPEGLLNRGWRRVLPSGGARAEAGPVEPRTLTATNERPVGRGGAGRLCPPGTPLAYWFA